MQTTLFISIGKLILGTGLLYLLYILLLKKRLNGNYARLFLILGTVIFTLSPFLPLSLLNKEEIYLITLPEINLQNDEDVTSDNSGEISFYTLFYVIPVVIGLLLFTIKLGSIFRIMYQSEKKQIDGFTTYFSEKIKYPFSFGQSIFVPASLHGEKLQIVFLHEKAHIRFGHTIDVLGFELLKIFGWFNPFYFLIERELRQAHEFSADEQVLATGTNISAYCDTLLSCALAGMNVPVNYFTGSQIKTRIQMMHKSKNKKSSLLLMWLAFTLIGSGVFFSPRLMGQNPSIQIENEFDKLPEFPGGQMEMVRFIGNNLIYPQTAIESNIEGKVIVEFTVSTDGKIKNIQVKRGIGYGCDEAAMRVVEKMPDWIPAEIDGKKVAAQMVLPINFVIQ